MKRLDSAKIWDGNSAIDGAPIVAIVTGLKRPSKNPKTGPMAQLWILRADISPLDAIASGSDRSICGDCGLRGSNGRERGCYVAVKNAPLAVWRRFTRGGYESLTPIALSAILRERKLRIRLGAYGDPAALPIAVIRDLVSQAPGWTGYTHRWQSRGDLAPYVMASADSPALAQRANALGFRTFRTRVDDQQLLPGEIACPASDEMDHRTSCDRCNLCNGATADDRRRSIAIIAHGPTTVHAVKFIRMMSVPHHGTNEVRL